MPIVTTEGVVLRTYRLAEADKIVIAMTLQDGLVRGVAHGARRLKSRFGASLEPWTCCDLTYFEKEGRELVTLKSADIKRSLFSISVSAEHVHALAYMSELTLEFMPPHEANTNMYRMIKACGEAIQIHGVEVRKLTQYFELWTLRLGGFLPPFKRCTACKRLLSGERQAYVNPDGAMRCGECAGGMGVVLSSEAITELDRIQRLSPLEYALEGVAAETAKGARADGDVQTDATPLQQSKAYGEVHQLLQRLIARALEREPRGRLRVNPDASRL